MITVEIHCDKNDCEEVYRAYFAVVVAACIEAEHAGWKADHRSGDARCPKHKGTGGANLITVGAGAL